MAEIGRRKPAELPADELRESLEELGRIADSLVDGLARDDDAEEQSANADLADTEDAVDDLFAAATAGESEPQPQSGVSRSLFETLAELERIDDPRADLPLPVEVAVAGDKGRDIDAHLDSLFAAESPGAPATVAVESEPAPVEVAAVEIETQPEIEVVAPAPIEIEVPAVETAAAPTHHVDPFADFATERAAVPVAAPAVEEVPDTLEPQRSRSGVWIAVAAILLLLAAAAWFFLPRETSASVDLGEATPPTVKSQPAPAPIEPPAPQRPSEAVVAPVVKKAPPPVKPAPSKREPEVTKAAPSAAVAEATPPDPPPLAIEPVALQPEPAPDPPAIEEATTAPAAPPAPQFEPPVAISRTEPIYPPQARVHREEGTVVLNVLVNERGQVVRVVVEQGIPGSALEAAAIDAVLRWTYQPGTEDGRPARAWISETFEFRP